MLIPLITNMIMQGLQKNPTTGGMNVGTGQFWGDVGKSLIPGVAGQIVNQQTNNPLTGNYPPQKECPDPNGIHGPGMMMNLISLYGTPAYLCPACGYRELAGKQI